MRLTWDVSVGREIPIFNRANFTEATTIKGSSGWGLWVDVSFHVIEELGKDESNPIINTDYRFSLAKVKYYRVIKMNPADKSYQSLAFKADLFHHESTHLGDEYVLHAQTLPQAVLDERGRPPFERFNQSQILRRRRRLQLELRWASHDDSRRDDCAGTVGMGARTRAITQTTRSSRGSETS